MMDDATRKAILVAQRNEVTATHIYRKLAVWAKDPGNSEVLARIGDEEAAHYDFFRDLSGREVGPSRLRIWWFFLIARVLGVTFGIKLMERGEKSVVSAYSVIAESLPELGDITEEEGNHEQELIDMIDEERLKYVGSMVLGLSDALVELTGALAGFTLALQNTRLIAMVGLITGLAASFSMAASEYLSTKTEDSEQSPVKASAYTGVAYVFTVMFLIAPYLIFDDLFLCLGLTVAAALVVILSFTYYVSVAQDISFRDRFLEMAGISLGVAALSFGIGFVVREFLGVDL
jgi:vacuolar iron transporter family protein